MPSFYITPKIRGGAVPVVIPPGGVTWNPLDRSSNCTLSNFNLTTVSADGASAGVRATTSHTTGKYYWEIQVNADGGAYDVAATVLTATSSLISADANNCQIFNGNGQIWVAGSLALQFPTAVTAIGNVIQVAVNLGTREVWFRGSIGTNWNDSGSANPTTPGSGQPLPATVALFPGVEHTALTPVSQLTANFGATAYVNTPPSGFLNW